jgi:GT2 family glycosyltransferase
VRQPPDVSVIVVNWNGLSWLADCLGSLRVQTCPSYEVILVDNASSDGSVDYVRQRFPEVQVVALEENRGFAGGNNAGAAVASGRFLAFLNNDAVAEPGWLEALRQSLLAAARPALATSLVVFADDPGVVDSAGDGWLRVGTGFKHGHGQPAENYRRAGEVFGACGAACMIRRHAFLELGGFDESFFLVFEDVDLSFRARLSGHTCYFVPSAVVRHAGSASLGRSSATSVYYGQRNVEWVFWKNTPTPLLLRSLPGHGAYLVAAALFFCAKGRLPAFLRAKAAALRGLPRILRQRSRLQASRAVTHRALWAAMTSGWVSTKRREKSAARPLPADRPSPSSSSTTTPGT